MKRIVLFLFLYNILQTFSIELVQEHKQAGNDLGISFQKYKLDNGLIVILHQDTTTDKVYLEMKYKIGAVDEPVGLKGSAHLFEHLMFSGTPSFPNETVWRLFPNTAECYLNAHTYDDFTTYENMFPANYLELAIQYEAERMKYTPSGISLNKFESEKAIVLQEYTMKINYNNAGLLFSESNKLLYPEGHPMRFNLFGNIEDIRNSNYDTTMAFFRKWYVPNNAILTLSGNFETNQALDWITAYFSKIDSVPLPEKHKQVEKIKLEKNKFIMLKSDIARNTYFVTFPTYLAIIRMKLNSMALLIC